MCVGSVVVYEYKCDLVFVYAGGGGRVGMILTCKALCVTFCMKKRFIKKG